MLTNTPKKHLVRRSIKKPSRFEAGRRLDVRVKPPRKILKLRTAA